MSIVANRIAGVVLATSCGAYFMPSLGFAPPPPSSTDPGMALWPQALAVVGFLASVALIIAPRTGSLLSVPTSGTDEEPAGSHMGASFAGMILAIVYAASWKLQLYFWTTPVFVAALLWICGARDLKMILGVTIGLQALAYVVFFRLLSVPLLSV